ILRPRTTLRRLMHQALPRTGAARMRAQELRQGGAWYRVGEVERPSVAIGQSAHDHAGEPAGRIEDRTAGFAFFGVHAQHHGVRIAEAIVAYSPSKAHRFDFAQSRDVAFGMRLAERKYRLAFLHAGAWRGLDRPSVEMRKLDQGHIIGRLDRDDPSRIEA